MTFSAGDLGDIERLARALGLVRADGSFNDDWLSNPGDYLSAVLSNDAQRAALLALVDDLLGGGTRQTDALGQIWLPLFESNDPPVSFYAVIDDRAADHVRIGVGIKITSQGPDSTTSLHLPLFKVGRGAHSIANPILLGQAGGTINFASDVTVDSSTPAPGQAHLRAVGLTLDVPTDGSVPDFGLKLSGLRLPGALTSRDIVLSLANIAELDDIVLDLVLGLLEAQARQAGGAVQAFARLIGISSGTAIPSLPLEQLAQRGVAAIADWAASLFGSASARSAWLSELANLLQNGAAVNGDRVELPFGAGRVTLGVDVSDGSGGLPVVTPVLGIEAGGGDVIARLDARLFRLDLGSGESFALPALEAVVQLGKHAGGGNALLSGDPRVDSLRFGIRLNENRRPAAILALLNVKIGTHPIYPMLDLSSPNAVIESAGQVIGDVIDQVLASLGPLGNALRTVLGISVPPGIPGLSPTDMAGFLRDPLGAVRDYWRELIFNHAAGVPQVLTPIRDLIADQASVGTAVSGSGTESDPWRIALVGPVVLQVARAASGQRIEIAVAAQYMNDTLGERCTRLDATFAMGLLNIDLAGGPSSFLSSISAGLFGRPRGSRKAMIEFPPLRLSADSVGIAARWTPTSGLGLSFAAPNPRISINEAELPLDIPDFSAGFAGLSDAQWDAVEFLVGQLAQLTPQSWVRELTDALGWIPDSPALASAERARLRLAAVVANPQTAIIDWINTVVLREASRVETLLTPLARIFTGTSGSRGILAGRGTPRDPYRINLSIVPRSPELALWVEPNGPPLEIFTAVTERLLGWRPGMPGLSPSELAEALLREAQAADDIADIISGRLDLGVGLGDLIERWVDTDGRVLAPDTEPTGVVLEWIEDQSYQQILAGLDLNTILSAVPATVLHIAVVESAADSPWPSAPAGRMIDLTAPDLAPAAFTLPSAASGEWFVLLGTRAAARLASGDSDGVAGQAARLERILTPFRALAGGIVLVARGGAGHAARRAANTVAEVSALVTVGTPFGAAAFSVLNTEPAASSLRLLNALLPSETGGDPFDADLTLGRDLLRGLLDLADQPALGEALAAPADPAPAPRAGLAVHAVFGRVSATAASRAVTAVIAAGLSARASLRAALPQATTVTGLGAGIRLPISIGAGDILVNGHAALELLGADLGGTPSLRATRPLSIHLEIRRRDGWLVGGPGSTTGHDLRWLEFNMQLPLGSGGNPEAEVVLHEPRVFSIRRDRWFVRHAGSTSSSEAVVTPALPEVGVLLSSVMHELSLDTDSEIASFVDLLEASGVFSLSASDGQGGFVASALDSILNQADAHFRQLVAAAPSRQALQNVINTLLTPIAGASVDLATRRADLSLSGTPGSVGLLSWSISAFVAADGSFGGSLRFGQVDAGLRIELNPLSAAIDWPRSDLPAPEIIPLWPTPNVSRLVEHLPAVIIANAARLGLGYLRELDDSARPIIDAALDALGLLSGTVASTTRSVRIPLKLVSDPVAWFKDPASFGELSGAFSPVKVVAFVDALKPLLGLSGASGQIQLATGVALAVSAPSGALRLGVSLDGAALTTPPGGNPRLAFGGSFALDIGDDGSLRPAVTLFAGMPGAASGRQALHLAVNGGVRLFLRPLAGSDISLYPDPPGLGSLAGAALQMVPFILDEIAKLTTPPLAANAAAIVSALGDALDLRSGAPPTFDAAKLNAWAENPAQRFADRLPVLVQASLTQIANAISPALPAPLAISAPSGHILLQAGPVAVDLTTAPFTVEVRINATGVPFAGVVASTIAFDSSGFRSFSGTVGPASIPVGDIQLHPLVAVAVGPGLGTGTRIDIGAALDAAGTDAVLARWNLSAGSFALVAKQAATTSTDPAEVALALVKIALDMAARFAMQTPALQSLLDTTVPHTTAPNTKVKKLLHGVFLQDGTEPPALDPALFDPSLLMNRFIRLLRNVGEAGPNINVGGGISIGLRVDGQIVKLTLGVNGRIDLTSGDILVSLEADSRWIKDQPAAGLAIGFLNLTGPSFQPTLSVNGIGIRIGRSSGALLDSVITLGSVAVHVFADVSATQLSGGVQLQLSDLAVGASGASGGSNAVAQGIMGDTGSGDNALAPSFSPALAVQKHGNGPVLVSLSAGDGDGPWWLSIQKGFGPLYIEQVGFGVTVRQDQLEKIAILFDGRVSIAGLVAAVDDLQIIFTVTSGASLFDPSRWAVDLAGLAVSADIAGVTLAGGLRKFSEGENVEYIGMLMARVATYGLSIYGGYGTGVTDGTRFTAFFAFGAITGPIGGPPAFFLTGIGGGFGINRDLIFPKDLSTFADFIMIKALDPSASAGGDPMQELVRIRNTFPMRRDRFWFAGGVSFTSFALVDGIAVVAVSFGGGFELTLLGLARMALPRPQVRLVSIELGLIVRFSTREGVMWIQAELTENSWLLHESVRLTGGFAYVMWFAGERSGEFVLTLGGYHPNFSRSGYPQVPRLGFRWQVGSNITIKGENYFALTSEALMAGGALEASARFGPAWANVSFGANVIIYFDPFRYEADAHARIAAGVTIDLWLGEITIKVSLGARIEVAGPDFHGRATFEVGPIELTVKFGGSDKNRWEPISWDAFVNKYLEAARPGVARVLTSLPGKGAIPPGTGPNGEEQGSADGSAQKPFEVLSEFELTVTTIAPATRLVFGGQTRNQAPSRALGIGPVGDATMSSTITLNLYPKDRVGQAAHDKMSALRLDSTSTGSFPVGAWGPVQARENKKIPKGEVVKALNGALFVSEAALTGTIPKEIEYKQVEAGPRKPLPFVVEKDDRTRVVTGAKKLVDLLPQNPNVDTIYATAAGWMADAGNSRLAVVSLRGERAAPPRLGALGERMASQTPKAEIKLATPDAEKEFDLSVHAPVAIAVLAPLVRGETVRRRTTVKTGGERILPPTLDAAEAARPAGMAVKLLRVAPRAAAARNQVLAERQVPLSRTARMAAAAVDARGADSVGRDRLKALSGAIGGTPVIAATARRTSADARIAAGEVAVLALPNARRDSGFDARPALAYQGLARIVMLGAGGAVLADQASTGGKVTIPQGTERIAVWAKPADASTGIAGLAGWHDAQSLAYVGWSTCLCRAGSVYSEAARLRRGPESFKAGWIGAKEFLADSRLIVTRFNHAPRSLVIVLDEHAPGDSAAEFSLNLEGASVARDQQGQELAPVVLAHGARRILVYAINPDAQAGAVTVKLLRDGSIDVVGVMAALTDAATVAARLTEQTAEAMLDAALSEPGESVAVRFVPPTPPAGGKKTTAAKKSPASKKAKRRR